MDKITTLKSYMPEWTLASMQESDEGNIMYKLTNRADPLKGMFFELSKTGLRVLDASVEDDVKSVIGYEASINHFAKVNMDNVCRV